MLVSLTTNFISNNACAVLFTPIAIDIAQKIDVDQKFSQLHLFFQLIHHSQHLLLIKQIYWLWDLVTTNLLIMLNLAFH